MIRLDRNDAGSAGVVQLTGVLFDWNLSVPPLSKNSSESTRVPVVEAIRHVGINTQCVHIFFIIRGLIPLVTFTGRKKLEG